MLKKYKLLFLTLIIVSYGLMQLATTKKCNDPDCRAISDVIADLTDGRNYILGANRCSHDMNILCVYADRDQGAGMDWNAVADTACTVAAQNGLNQQYVLILSDAPGPAYLDTLARKQCP